MSFICRKLLRIGHVFLACLKRIACFLRPRQQRIGELPYTVKQTPDGATFLQEPHSNSTWEEWTQERNAVQDQIELYRSRMQRESRTKQMEQTGKEEKEKRKEPDLFQDLAPQLKRPKKILLRPKTDAKARFAAAEVDNPSLMVPTTEEWGELQENTLQQNDDDAWEFDHESIDTALKEQKQRERREKNERRNNQKSQQQHGQKRVDAVRISFDE